MFKLYTLTLLLVITSFAGVNTILEAQSQFPYISMSLHSLIHRADELGLLFKPNLKLSAQTNKILGSLQTRTILPSQQPSIASQAIDTLLHLFIQQPYEIENNQISFDYSGLRYNNNVETFANEILLMAHVAEHINNFPVQEEISILSNTFKDPIPYLFLYRVVYEQNHPFKITILGGLDKKKFDIMIRRLPKEMRSMITFYDNTLQFNADSNKRKKFDIFMLNPAININHKTLNMASCSLDDKLIRLFPQQFDNTFLKKSFLAVNDKVSRKELELFMEDLTKKTKQGPQALKDQQIAHFTCSQKQSGTKMLADLIYANHTQSKAKLFFFDQHKIISANIPLKDLSNLIKLYGFLLKIATNLKNNANVNAPLKSNIKFYRYNANRKTFKRSISVNNIDLQAVNLTDNV